MQLASLVNILFTLSLVGATRATAGDQAARTVAAKRWTGTDGQAAGASVTFNSCGLSAEYSTSDVFSISW